MPSLYSAPVYWNEQQYLLSFYDPFTFRLTISLYIAGISLIPSACSAPGCISNYYPDDRVHIFRVPENPPELKQAWIRALHCDNIDRLKVVNVCIKHFREEDVEYIHKVPNGDGTFTSVPRYKLKLKGGAIPCLLPGCPSYYSSTSTSKRARLSYEPKEKEMLNQTIQLLSKI
ncbi:hypothetical protein LOD99_8168 [Oopsacas minuta]|uniref:THAP-type domain-containing protein n=1 Tax=Oopsacas minuta TaxID=111878 RepID=A0AAV7JHV4_9METZ|nr:hypothetical protein LOD99_8168 [Oopsacas minuta]